MLAMAIVQVASARARHSSNCGSGAPGGEGADSRTARGADPYSFQSLHVPPVFNIGVMTSIVICGRWLGDAQQ
jgi:hypothetical protein